MRLSWIGALALAASFGNIVNADTPNLFGQADATWDAQISPNGTHLAIGCSPNGRMAVCIHDTASAGRPKLFEPAEDQRLLDFYWASDDHLVANISFFERISTSDGLREFEVRRAISYNLPRERSRMLMQQASNFTSLTDLKSTCDSDPDNVAMELRVRQEEGPTTGSLVGAVKAGLRTILYEVDLDNGRMRERESDRASVWTYILDIECEVAGRVLFNDERQTFAIEMGTGGGRRTILEMGNTPTLPMAVRGFNADRSALIVDGFYGDVVGYHEVDIATGEVKPLKVGDVTVGEAGLIFSPYNDTILGIHSTRHLREETYSDPTLAELQGMLSSSLPGRSITLRSTDRSGDRFTFKAEAAGTPADYFLVDLIAGQVQPIGKQAPQLDGQALGAIQPFTYTARDGLPIPAYVTLPPGKSTADGPFPTILMPHGGPEARDTAEFDWWAQALAAEGYAVIQPNFRGSDGYGAMFRDRGFGQFGGAMVDDVLDAIAWAEAEGIASDAGVCSVGASYGGYSALMTALRSTDKVKCVVAVAPVTNVFDLMARHERGTAPFNYWARYVGADTFSDDAAKSDITPADRASEIDAPVLLLHGTEDRVVRPSQSGNFERAWGERPGLRYVKIEGQDHYLTSTASRELVLRESLAHLAAHHPDW